MKRSCMEKCCKRIGVPLIVMATLFLGMGQANAIPIVSTLGNPPSVWNNVGNPAGQALTTGQSVTATSVSFIYGVSPTDPSLTILDADVDGKIGSNVIAVWDEFGTSGGNVLTFSGSATLDANQTYWFLVADASDVYLTVADGVSYVANFGATLPAAYNNYGSYGDTYYSLSELPLMFEVQGSPVPIPGAVWLLGSGLLGLVGLKRRRGKEV